MNKVIVKTFPEVFRKIIKTLFIFVFIFYAIQLHILLQAKCKVVAGINKNDDSIDALRMFK